MHLLTYLLTLNQGWLSPSYTLLSWSLALFQLKSQLADKTMIAELKSESHHWN